MVTGEIREWTGVLGSRKNVLSVVIMPWMLSFHSVSEVMTEVVTVK